MAPPFLRTPYLWMVVNCIQCFTFHTPVCRSISAPSVLFRLTSSNIVKKTFHRMMPRSLITLFLKPRRRTTQTPLFMRLLGFSPLALFLLHLLRILQHILCLNCLQIKSNLPSYRLKVQSSLLLINVASPWSYSAFQYLI